MLSMAGSLDGAEALGNTLFEIDMLCGVILCASIKLEYTASGDFLTKIRAGGDKKL